MQVVHFSTEHQYQMYLYILKCFIPRIQQQFANNDKYAQHVLLFYSYIVKLNVLEHSRDNLVPVALNQL